MLEGSLKAAVSGAKFVVTINSNAANEALAWGCPAICMGPHLAVMAGVAKQAPLLGLDTSLREMLDGWKPDRKALTNYLRWLACRQWSRDEIAQGECLKAVLDAASS